VLAGYQTCGNLPTIQIVIIVDYTLRQFCQKVKSGHAEISEIIEVVDSFNSCCPLCHQPDCVRFQGYYYRRVVDEKGRYYRDFPVPRFLCGRKTKGALVNHRTFSLLHYHLAPYSKYSIPFIIKTLQARHINGVTIERLQSYLCEITSTGNDYIELSASGIVSFKHLLLGAINKILISGWYPRFAHELGISGDETVVIRTFLEFCRHFISQKRCYFIRGPCALSYDFYITGGSYLKNAFFLFGTPSQFRMAKERVQCSNQ
jgi:hypothetical protein